MNKIVIKCDSIVTFDCNMRIIKNAWIVIEDGIISDIGEGEIIDKYKNKFYQQLDFSNNIIIPSMTNHHTHLCQGIMKGVTSEQELSSWLDKIRPIRLNISPKQLKLSIILSLLDNLQSGVTNIVHHNKIDITNEHILVALEAIVLIGIKTKFILGIRRLETKLDIDKFEEQILFVLKYISYNKIKNIILGIGPTLVPRLKEKEIIVIRKLSEKYNLPLHYHVSETIDEVNQVIDIHKLRPIEWLDKLGLINSNTELVHCNHINTNEINIILKRKASVIHCPVSNMFLSAGVLPINEINQKNIPIYLGTDGSASNNTQNMFETIKFSSLLSKISYNKNKILPQNVLRMAMGKNSKVGFTNGKIEIGMNADFIFIKNNSINNIPNYNIYTNLVYSINSSDIAYVMIDGKFKIKNGKIIDFNYKSFLSEIKKYENEIQNNYLK